MIGFRKNYDVIVAGGGVAGAAAALAAARMGASTALVEKTVLLGGLATAGNVFGYVALCDGRGRKVTGGIAEEFLHTSIRYGPGDIPDDWQEPDSTSRYATRFAPAAFALALDDLLEEAGVSLWFDTLACIPLRDGPRIVGMAVENKSGRGVLEGTCIIDATGDADLAFRAGANCEEAENYLSIWTMQSSLEGAKQAVEEGSGSKLLEMKACGGSDVGHGHPPGMRKFKGTRGHDVSQFVVEGRRLLRDFYRERHAELGANGRKDVFPICLPSMADFRTTRRIKGQVTLGSDDAWKHFDDSVGLIADWHGGGGTQRDVWEIPYAALLPIGIEGVLAAGRCISSEGEAWQMTRVIPAAALTGEIAGTAAALCIRTADLPHTLPIEALRSSLQAKGIPYESMQEHT